MFLVFDPSLSSLYTFERSKKILTPSRTAASHFGEFFRAIIPVSSSLFLLFLSFFYKQQHHKHHNQYTISPIHTVSFIIMCKCYQQDSRPNYKLLQSKLGSNEIVDDRNNRHISHNNNNFVTQHNNHNRYSNEDDYTQTLKYMSKNEMILRVMVLFISLVVLLSLNEKHNDVANKLVEIKQNITEMKMLHCKLQNVRKEILGINDETFTCIDFEGMLG